MAVENGIREIAFTDHFDLHALEKGRGYYNYQKYSSEIAKCRDSFGERLSILKGLELGEPHLYLEEHSRYFKDKDFDFLLGSVHWIADEAMHNDYCRGKEAKKAYEAYFAQVFQAAAEGNFDVLGHLDILKRYAPSGFGKLCIGDYREVVEQILKTALERGIGLELNTSGWRQGVGEPFPSLEVLRWYRELGGEIITVGSDSHVVDDLGSDIKKAYLLLRDLGFKWLTVFRQRSMEQLPLSNLI